MLSTVRKWGEFVKFSHTVFALPFALAAMVVAAREKRGWPGWDTFLLILAAMICARTCAMSFNRIVDRHFDKKKSPHGRTPFAGRTDYHRLGMDPVRSQRGRFDRSQLLSQSNLFLPVTRGDCHRVFLFVDQAVH